MTAVSIIRLTRTSEHWDGRQKQEILGESSAAIPRSGPALRIFRTTFVEKAMVF